jgi:predicted N-acetyltransferase YhbS
MKDLVLREATEADLAAIVTLVRSAFEEYRGQIDPPSSAHQETVEHVRHKMTTARVLLAVQDNVTVGCVFYEPRERHIYFFRLAVLPRHRRRGIGRTLIEEVEARARETGVQEVHLGVRMALRFLCTYYEGLGYNASEYGSHPGYSTSTYVIMKKTISSVAQAS